MIWLLISLLFVQLGLSASIDIDSLIRQQEEKIDQVSEDEWFKTTLKDSIAKVKKIDLEDIKKKNAEILKNAKPCHLFSDHNPDHEINIFISFSAPMRMWKEYSSSLEKVGGAFIVRGLPNNSFQEFAKTILKLRNNGVSAPILIDPSSFEKHQINVFPTFVLKDDTKSDMVSGTISLDYALTLFSERGDTANAEKYLLKLREGN